MRGAAASRPRLERTMIEVPIRAFEQARRWIGTCWHPLRARCSVLGAGPSLAKGHRMRTSSNAHATARGGRRGALLGGSLRRCAFSALRGFDEKTRDSASLSRRQFELGVPRNIIVRQAIVAYPFHARQVHVGAEAPCLNVHAAVVNSAHLDESLAIRYRVASKSSQSAHEFSSPVGLTVLRMSCERNKRPTVALVCPIHKETGVRSPPCGQSFSGG